MLIEICERISVLSYPSHPYICILVYQLLHFREVKPFLSLLLLFTVTLFDSNNFANLGWTVFPQQTEDLTGIGVSCYYTFTVQYFHFSGVVAVIVYMFLVILRRKTLERRENKTHLHIQFCDIVQSVFKLQFVDGMSEIV